MKSYFFSGDNLFLLLVLRINLPTTRNNFGDFLSILPFVNGENPSGTSMD